MNKDQKAGDGGGNSQGWDLNGLSALMTAFLTFFLVRFTAKLVEVGDKQRIATEQSAQAAKDAAKAAEDAAKAASDSAAATDRQVKQSERLERPWIVVELVDADGMDAFDSFRLEGTTIPASINFAVEVRMRNGGRTAATVIVSGYRYTTRTKLDAEPEYPIGEIAPRMWAPDFTTNNRMEMPMDALMLEELAAGERVLAMFGHVIYRGPVEVVPDYESRFCVILRVPPREPCFFQFGGPKAYNSYT